MRCLRNRTSVHGLAAAGRCKSHGSFTTGHQRRASAAQKDRRVPQQTTM